MDQLKEARQRIDQIDEEMARLFCERMQAAELVAEHKKVHGLPVYDKDREAALINKNMKLVENPVYREYYVNFLKDVMKISRQYQHRLLQGMKVAYSGVEGAFAAIAAGNFRMQKKLPAEILRRPTTAWSAAIVMQRCCPLKTAMPARWDR